MRLFTRFTIAIIGIALALSGCGSSKVDDYQSDPALAPILGDTAESRGAASSDELTGTLLEVCKQAGYPNVPGVCARITPGAEQNDPTTERNREVFRYVISGERELLLYAAYKPFVNKLFSRMLSGEIPYTLNSGRVKLLPKSGEVIKDKDGDYVYEPLPQDGWGIMVATMLTDSGSERESIRLKVKITNGQLDRTVEPLWFDLYTPHGDLHFYGPRQVNSTGNLLPHTSSSMDYFMNVWDEGPKPSVSLIDYVTPYAKPSPAYQRQLGPDDMDLTVLTSQDIKLVSGSYSSGLTIEDIKRNDARFLEILASVDKDGSYWYD